jgi:signal peptidase II
VPELQAARGASLITDEASGTSRSESGRESPASRRAETALVLLVALVAYAVDQVTKVLAVHRLAGRAPVDVVGTWLRFDLLRNPGAAFSTGTSWTPLITLVAIVASVVVVVFAFRVRHRGWAVALGLLLAGVVGNLTDRILRTPGPFRGHVVDFIALPHWPVFNVADICIDVAGALLVLLLLRGASFDGSPRAEEGESPERGTEPS